MIDAVQILWSPAGVTLSALDPLELVDVTDGDTPNLRLPVRVGCQKQIMAGHQQLPRDEDYDAPSLVRRLGGGLVWSGHSSSWRCVAALS
jgi:hypothetical protein